MDEFSCTDGSSGIIVCDKLIYRAECSPRAWASNAPVTAPIVRSVEVDRG